MHLIEFGCRKRCDWMPQKNRSTLYSPGSPMSELRLRMNIVRELGLLHCPFQEPFFHSPVGNASITTGGSDTLSRLQRIGGEAPRTAESNPRRRFHRGQYYQTLVLFDCHYLLLMERSGVIDSYQVRFISGAGIMVLQCALFSLAAKCAR